MNAVSIGDALASACERIAAADARTLLRHAIGASSAALAAHPERPVPLDALAKFREWVGRRAHGEPVAYIVGEREFYGRRFLVGPSVLIPRPETELLVDLAIGRMRGSRRAPRVLDLGTGSGAIAITLSLEIPAAEVWATDSSAEALALGIRNADALGAAVRFLQSDWLDRLPEGNFDLVVSNPPYVEESDAHLGQGDLRFEPRGALAAGADGLEAIRRIVAGAPSRLRPGGWLLLEHGWNQAVRVRDLLGDAGFERIESHRDLAGIERVSLGRWRDEDSAGS